MKVISINVNGIRSAARKGFFKWLESIKPEIVCLQEVRASEKARLDSVIEPKGYHTYYADAAKNGYSGVSIYALKKPSNVTYNFFCKTFEDEGRWIKADFGCISIISLYMPSGTSGEKRQKFKFESMKKLKKVFREFYKDKREYLICGDFNIAHKEIDLKNWKSNKNNSGFLPEERAWMDWLCNDLGMIDIHRSLDKSENLYTWWSNRGKARENNVGWRIDYQVGTPLLANLAKKAEVYKSEYFSDHAPLIIDYNLNSLRSKTQLS